MGKKIKKLIPKEIAPAVPFIAAYFGGPALGKALFSPAAGVLSSAQLATAKGLTAALASKATGGDTKSALRSGFLAAAPDVISGGLGKFEQAYGFKPADVKALSSASELTKATPMQELASIASKGKQAIEGAGFLKTVGAQTVAEAGARAVDLNEKALRDYEAQLREQGIMDSAERRNKIFGYFSNAGYDPTEVNSFLDKYGYAYGGRVGFKEGGGIQALIDYLKEKEDEDEEFNLGKFSTGLEGIKSGYEIATGQPLMGPKPQPTRFGLAEGGIPMTQNARKTIKELIEAGMLEDEGEGILDLIRKNPDMIGGPIMPTQPETFDLESYKIKVKNLPMFVQNFVDDFKRENGRNPTIEEIKMYANKVTPAGFADGGMINLGGREMDMRGGGFIPIGAKERADDVPARLSKNEFVMTADAVRAAGGGSINKGAKRMYDLMNKLEAKA